MSDYQIAADTLREDVSGDAELVTVATADVRAVLARLEALEAMAQRAREIYTGTLDTSHQLGPIGVATARFILGEA